MDSPSPPEDFLSQLNPVQRAAVTYLGGPELVIAGAGSGKTRVLTYKITYMLYQGYEPWRMLALTFTNKAANEMRERIDKLVGSKVASRLWMGTFHSIFARILRYNADKLGYNSNFTIYDSSDSKSLIKMIIKDLGLDEKVYRVGAVQNAISTAKNALLSPDDYVRNPDLMEADAKARRPRLYEVYRAYCYRCFVAGAMDFDDLLFNTYRLLRENPEILRHYSEYFRYILVDEYQDTNFAQHTVITMLTEPQGNLCVVGDDAQSIYSFRGASIRNILNLDRIYPNLEIFKLEQNYRSTQTIINAANSLIAKNKDQIKKTIFSQNDVGSKIELIRTYSDMEEAILVASRISQLKMATGDSYEEFAILYRTNAQSRQLEEALRKRNIEYRIWGGLSFYQRKEVKDAVAYLRLAVNNDDEEALRRIINYPTRGIGETTLKKLTHCALEAGVSIWRVMMDPDDYNHGLGKAAVRKLESFRELINDFSAKAHDDAVNAYDAAKYIVEGSGIMAEFQSDRTPESISRRENVAELLNGIREFVDLQREQGEETVRLIDFLTQASLATDQDRNTSSGEAVTLMTVHASKGLEFGNVFIVGVEDELFPSSMSKDSVQAIEEERRLLYVAITRAKRFCMLSYASKRFRNGQVTPTKISPFLRDIDSKCLSASDSSDISSSAMRNPMEHYRMSYHSGGSPAPAASSRYDSPPSAQPQRSVFGASAPASSAMPRKTTVADDLATVGGEFTVHHPTEVKAGQQIIHERFGLGVIVAVDTSQREALITVKFDTAEMTKKLMLKFAKFKILN